MTNGSPTDEPSHESTREFADWLRSDIDKNREQARLPDYLRKYPEFADEIARMFAEFCDPHASVESLQPTVDSTINSPNSARPVTVTDSLVGKFLGRYRIDKFLGQGGFGEVWLGFDPELKRVVAVKLARRDRNTAPESIDRFLAEARKAASLSHSNIVQVYDIAMVDEGWVIVSEYISGQPLSKRLREGPVSWGFAVSTVIDIAKGLQHAHVRDLIHRDVKPANILLRDEGGAVLTDFGLAVTEQELISEPDRISGTIRYMSPEQARGDAVELDHRTDIFSLGLVLYMMLAGRLPYPESDTDSYIRSVASRPPRPIRSIVEAIPPDLERICMRALAFKAENRYASSQEFAEALEEWLDACDTANSTRTLVAPPTAPWPAKWAIAVVGVIATAAAATLVMRPSRLERIPEGSVSPGQPEGAQKVPQDLEPQPFVPLDGWVPLLAKEPKKFSWRSEFPRGEPRFSSRLNQFGVESEFTRWVFECAQIDDSPFRLRAILRIKDWVGHGGLTWGLRQDPDSFQEVWYFGYALEFVRQTTDHPSKLVLRELHMQRVDFDEVKIEGGRILAEHEIATPEQPELPIEIEVEQNQIRTSWGSGQRWEPGPIVEAMDWIIPGKTGIGITGQGRDVEIRNLSIRQPTTQKDLQ